MIYSYSEDNDLKSNAVDTILRILSESMNLNSGEAKTKFDCLEIMLKNAGFNGSLLNSFEDGRKILNQLSKYNSHCEEHEIHYKKLIKCLDNIQENIENYRKIA